MSRSSASERAERINAARVLLARHASAAEAVAELQSVYGMSRRQAYRYVDAAKSLKHPIPTPKSKIAFTIKVPVELVDAVREKARSTGRSISEIVTEALEKLLGRGRRRG